MKINAKIYAQGENLVFECLKQREDGCYVGGIYESDRATEFNLHTKIIDVERVIISKEAKKMIKYIFKHAQVKQYGVADLDMYFKDGTTVLLWSGREKKVTTPRCAPHIIINPSFDIRVLSCMQEMSNDAVETFPLGREILPDCKVDER